MTLREVSGFDDILSPAPLTNRAVGSLFIRTAHLLAMRSPPPPNSFVLRAAASIRRFQYIL